MLKKEINTCIGAAAVASAIVLFAIGGTSQALNLSAGEPAPGTCKRAQEIGVAPSPVAAQQMWSATVSAKFGTKWAIWVGSKDKYVAPINGGSAYQAVAKPCFYQPVR
jgi:uncharacterized glyoxalase superfamily protein PhnB